MNSSNLIKIHNSHIFNLYLLFINIGMLIDVCYFKHFGLSVSMVYKYRYDNREHLNYMFGILNAVC